jgi:hypothetical protein
VYGPLALRPFPDADASVSRCGTPVGPTTAALPRCHLLQLPAELRIYIYELVFASISFAATPEEITRCTALLETRNFIFNDAKLIFRRCKEQLFEMLAESRRGNPWLSVQRREDLEVRRMFEEVAAYAGGGLRLTRMVTAVKVVGARSLFQGLRNYGIQEARKKMERQDRLRRAITLQLAL